MLNALNAYWIRFIGSEYLVTGPALAMGLFLILFALMALFFQYLNLRRENRIFQMELGINTRIDETNYELNERLLKLNEQIKNMAQEIDPSLSLFEQCREAMVMVCDGRILDINQTAMDLFGYDGKDEFLTKTPVDLFPETQPDGSPSMDAYRQGLSTAEQSGRASMKWTFLRGDHSPIETETVISLIQRCGRQVFLLSIRERAVQS